MSLFLKPLFLIGMENILEITHDEEPSEFLKIMKMHKEFRFQLLFRAQVSPAQQGVRVPIDLNEQEIVNYMANFVERTLLARGLQKRQVQRYL